MEMRWLALYDSSNRGLDDLSLHQYWFQVRYRHAKLRFAQKFVWCVGSTLFCPFNLFFVGQLWFLCF